MSKHSQLADSYFTEGYNCAQAVLLAFTDVTGISKSASLKIASSFGGGMGKLREVCGALSASFIILGILYGYDDPRDSEAKTAHYARIQEVAAEFRSHFGTIICRDLLALKTVEITPVPEERTPEYYKKRKCNLYVETAAEILDSYIERNGISK